MALDTFMPQMFSQEFERPELFEFPYVMMATDRSSLVPAGSNQVSWPDVEGSIVTQTYTRGTDLTDGEGQDAMLTLKIDQFDSFAIPLDDLDRQQRLPNVLSEYTVQGSRELLWKVNENNRTVYRTGGPVGSNRLGSSLTEPMRGNHVGLTSNTYELELLHTGGTGTGHPKWGTAEGRQAIIAAMDTEAGAFAKRHGWVSQNADTKGVCVVPIQVGQEFRRYLIDDKPNLGVGNIVDSAFGYGRIMMISGWEILEDVTAAAFAVNAADDTNIKLDFFHPMNRSLYYGRQLQSMETERIQKQFGTRLKGLYMHGAVQGAARHMFEMSVSLADS